MKRAIKLFSIVSVPLFGFLFFALFNISSAFDPNELPYELSDVIINGSPADGFVFTTFFHPDCSASGKLVYYYNNSPDHLILDKHWANNNYFQVPISSSYSDFSIYYKIDSFGNYCGNTNTTWTSTSNPSSDLYRPLIPYTGDISTIITTTLPIVLGNNFPPYTSFLTNYGLVEQSPLIAPNFDLIQFNIPTNVDIISPPRQQGYPYYLTDDYNRIFTFRTYPKDNYSLIIRKYPTQADKFANTNFEEVCSVQVSAPDNDNNYTDIDCTLSHSEPTNAYYRGLFEGNNQSFQFDFGTLYQEGSSIGDILADPSNPLNQRPAFNCAIWDIPCLVSYVFVPYPDDFSSLSLTLDDYSDKIPFSFLFAFIDFVDFLGNASPEDAPNQSINIMGNEIELPIFSTIAELGDMTISPVPWTFRNMMIFTYYLGTVIILARLATGSRSVASNSGGKHITL